MAPARKAGRSADTGRRAAPAGVRTSKLRVLGVALVCAKVALVPLVFDHSLDWPFTVSKALVSHGIAYVLLGVMVGLFLQHGREAVRWSWLHIPVLLFFVANLTATVFAADVLLGMFGTHTRMLGLGTIADGVILYFAVVCLVRTRGDATALFVAAVLASTLVVTYELVQFFGLDPFIWNRDSVWRPFSTLGQPTVLAQYLTSVALAILAVGSFATHLRPAPRVALLGYSCLLLAAAAMTGTRSAVVGVGTGAAMLLLLVWLHHPSPRARTMSVVGSAVAVAGLTALVLFSPIGARLLGSVDQPLENADRDIVGRLEPSFAVRAALYAIALDAVRARPLLGYGPDNFVVAMSEHRPLDGPDEIRLSPATSAHSWLAQVTVSSGLVGLGTFLAILVVASALALRHGSLLPAVAGVVTLASFLGTGLTTVNDVGTDFLLWIAIGSIAAAAASATDSTGDLAMTQPAQKMLGPRRKSPIPAAAAIACVSAGLLLSGSAVSAFDASRANHQSHESRLVGKAQDAVASGLRATQSDPRRPDYWHQLGLAYVSGTRWSEARAALEHAKELGPHDLRYVSDLAQVDLALMSFGDRSAAAEALELADEAVRIEPNLPRAHLTRAVVMQFTGNIPEALFSIERALSLRPPLRDDGLFIVAAQVLLASGRPADAVRVASESVAALGETQRSVALRIELARGLVALGRPTDALVVLDVALSIQPNNTTAQRLRTEVAASVAR